MRKISIATILIVLVPIISFASDTHTSIIDTAKNKSMDGNFVAYKIQEYNLTKVTNPATFVNIINNVYKESHAKVRIILSDGDTFAFFKNTGIGEKTFLDNLNDSIKKSANIDNIQTADLLSLLGQRVSYSNYTMVDQSPLLNDSKTLNADNQIQTNEESNHAVAGTKLALALTKAHNGYGLDLFVTSSIISIKPSKVEEVEIPTPDVTEHNSHQRFSVSTNESVLYNAGKTLFLITPLLQ
jgi:hypothetical protein